MATFNGARFLRQQLESLAAQTLRPLELQIGDDGSTDETIELIEAFAATAPFPVRLQRNPERLGFGENFLQTALRCSSEWIAFCDQDDIWMPEKLATCREIIVQGPADLKLVTHDATVVDDQLRPIGQLNHYPDLAYRGRLSMTPEWLCMGLTQVFRSELVRNFPISPRPSYPWRPERGAHDLWTSLLANALGTIAFCGKRLVLYRRHTSTVTSDDVGADVLTRVGRLFPDRGASFAARSQYLAGVAGLLEERAEASVGEQARAHLREAAAMASVQSEFFAIRGRAYASDSLGARFRAFRELAAVGGYRGSRAWPFGTARMLKDIALIVLARSFAKG